MIPRRRRYSVLIQKMQAPKKMKTIEIKVGIGKDSTTVCHKFENEESAKNYLSQWLSNHGIEKFDAEVNKFTVWKRICIKIK